MVAKTTIVRFATACLMVCCFVFSGANLYAQRDAVPTDEATINLGKSLFSEYTCNTCHAVGSKKVGPDLAGIYDRREIEWINSWIRNSQVMIQNGDPQAVALWEEYKPSAMAAFDLDDDQIMAILAYVRDAEENPDIPVADTNVGTPGAGGSGEGGVPSAYLQIIIVVLIIVLVLILGVLGLIVKLMRKYIQDQKDLSEQDEEIANEKFSLSAFVKSPTVIGIITFLVIVLAAKNVIDGLYTVGVQQGYAPKQPIAFSHKIHAGQYEIDCQYCHTGVEIGKSANIPSVNICMNCHSQIKTDSPEIKKLYTAQETGEPIEWVRVHNLPDLAYFNHSQHVKVGQIECQTCHGEIQEMEVVKQHAPLTMGWCIDCHRNTDVNSKGNGYYNKLVELHNKSSKTPLKVADIGGLECAKCHY
ncbi:cytochrome c3 family protein [Roseivirga misakiensis]|uniref:Cytochrome C n=1 Tax=Roseivirga misakiensis TaxID=1563681 RepID=A0A1E5T308_9BACT|nr:cytochrome c3 family protein [Roseivirga misakiensis]OEK05657.1 cytochrome C [Roseivirga misakiensis]